jgi:hypothetical protein
MKNLKKFSTLLLLLFIANHLLAQQFNTTARLSNIKTDGLHSIAISPVIRSFSKADLSDLRLYGADNKEVPFYIWKNSRNTTSINFEEFPMLSKEILPNKASNVIIENIGSKVIDEIVLNIANSKLLKTCDISGSNDQTQWFGLLDKYKISDLENTASTNVFVNIKLPKSSYRYLKFQINDTKTAPIDLLKIGVFKQSLVHDKLLSVNPTSLKYDTDVAQKKTQIIVSFKEPQIIENIDFQIIKPNYYKRNVRILVSKTILKKHNKKENYLETLAEFELNSNKNNEFELPTISEKEIIIEIDNEDNPALKIANMNFTQLPVYIVADLKANENYTLKTGSSELFAPNYDITHFKNSTISTLPTASFLEINTIRNQVLTQNKNTSFWQNRWFLWLCIGVLGVVIFYFSSDLLKEIK